MSIEYALPDRNYKQWEYIASETWRLKVFGGWLVRYAQSNSMIFMPDPLHEWQWIKIVGSDNYSLREKRNESI